MTSNAIATVDWRWCCGDDELDDEAAVSGEDGGAEAKMDVGTGWGWNVKCVRSTVKCDFDCAAAFGDVAAGLLTVEWEAWVWVLLEVGKELLVEVDVATESEPELVSDTVSPCTVSSAMWMDAGNSSVDAVSVSFCDD